MTEPTQHVQRPRCHTLLAWCVSLFVAAYAAAPAHAQAVAPNDCADANPAKILDDGNDEDMITDGDSVAVGCGSEVQRNEQQTEVSGEVPVVTLDRGNDGEVDVYLLKVDCDANPQMCVKEDQDEEGNPVQVQVDGIQYADLSAAFDPEDPNDLALGADVDEARRNFGQRLADRLGQVDTKSLTEDEKADLRTALDALQELHVIDTDAMSDESLLRDATVTINLPKTNEPQEVADGVAVGKDAKVKADGGVAIGEGATVGTDVVTTRTLHDDPDLGVYTHLEETKEGGGGVDGIAIGNGAMATGDGSIAIGRGAVATEDGQVMIGTHDIGAMHDGVMENEAGVAENKENIATNATGIATNATGIATNEAGVAENKENIATNEAGVAENKENIATNATGIATNATGIATNATGIATNATDIATNEAGVAENKENIATNATGIATNEAGIATNATDIATNEAGVAENKENIATNATGIATNEAGVAENKENIATNATDIATNEAGVAENKENIATNATGVADNRTMIGANSMRLDGHDADLAANRNQLSQHAAMLSQHADSIQNNTMQIKMLDERVNQVAAMAAALSAVPNAPDRDEKFFLGIGMGSHDGESSVAAGLAGRLGANKNIVINAGVANSGGGTTVRAGIGWSF